MSPGSPAASEGDERLLRRAARDVAVRIAAAVALVLVAVGVVVVVVGDAQETRSTREATRAAWESADDVGDPPVGTWLVVAGSDGTEVTPGAPTWVQQLDPARLPDGAEELGPDGRGFAVWTGDRSIGRVSAVYDMGPLELRERRVRVSVVAAVLLGSAGAAVVGAVVARRAVRPLGAALGLQRRFVADASHELRTPLSVVLTRAQLLRRRAGHDLDPASRTELDQLVRDVKAMADVIDDLLLAAQLEHGAPTRGAVDVVDLGQEVVTSLQPLAAELGLRLRFEAPSAGDRPMVTGSAAALRRALTALLDNALRHGPHGSEVLLQVAVDPLGATPVHHVRLTVQDAGAGLDPDDLAPLLQRFARGTTEGDGRRFGLGLALIDEVARAHGGDLTVARGPGGGAAFSLHLPLTG